MRAFFHAEFPVEVQRHAAAYEEISLGLGVRCRREVAEAIAAIKAVPSP